MRGIVNSLTKGVDYGHFVRRLGLLYPFLALNTLRYPKYSTSLQIVNDFRNVWHYRESGIVIPGARSPPGPAALILGVNIFYT